MKLIIPAAGRGLRFAGMENPLPKLLIPVAGRPLISHILRMASATKSFSQVIIILGPYIEHVMQTIKDLSTSIKWSSSMEIVCLRNPKFEFTNNIYSLYLARDYIVDDCVIHNCDVLVSPLLLERLVTQKTSHACLVLVDRTKPIPEAETKITSIAGDEVVRFGEDIPANAASGRYIGVTRVPEMSSGVFRDGVVSLIENGETGVFYTKVIGGLAEQSLVRAVWSNGEPWFEIDTLDDLRSVGIKPWQIAQEIQGLREGQIARVTVT